MDLFFVLLFVFYLGFLTGQYIVNLYDYLCIFCTCVLFTKIVFSSELAGFFPGLEADGGTTKYMAGNKCGMGTNGGGLVNVQLRLIILNL